MNIYYVSENFCYSENEYIPNDKFCGTKNLKQIVASTKEEARKIYNELVN